MATLLVDETMDLGGGVDRNRLGKSVGSKWVFGWFTRMVSRYLRTHAAATATDAAKASGTHTERAERACRRACIKSAISGATAGATATGATIAAAATEELAAFIVVPIAAGSIAGEMFYRAFLHVELTCELARIFEIPIDPDDPQQIWQLYALVFGVEEHDETSDDPGQGLIARILRVEGSSVGEEIGGDLVGETVARNIVPVFGIATSAYANYRMTKRLGDTLRRSFRYRRALQDALDRAGSECHAVLDLLIEGLWFVFTADGRLVPEEAAALAWMLRPFPEAEQRRIHGGFVEDELSWMDRIRTVPPEVREAFFHALEVGATVDKIVSPPERKLLRRIARELEIDFDSARLERMTQEFESVGILR